MSQTAWLVTSSLVFVFGLILSTTPLWMPFDVEDELLQTANRETNFGQHSAGRGTLWFRGYKTPFIYDTVTTEETNARGVILRRIQQVNYRESSRNDTSSASAEGNSVSGRVWVIQYESELDPENGSLIETRITTPCRVLRITNSRRDPETVSSQRLIWHRSEWLRSSVLVSGAFCLIASCVTAIRSLRATRKQSQGVM